MTKVNGEFYKALQDILGKDRVSHSRADRLIYSRDFWPLLTLKLQGGKAPQLPDYVVWPKTADEVSEVVSLARREGVPVVPFGAGSGVNGGTVPVKGGIMLDLKKMNRLLSVNDQSLIAVAEAGIIGETLERRLNAKGYTLGHLPASIYCSTLGGWLACRSAGQLSTKYGKIEDMVLGLQVVLADGRIVETKTAPRTATGPDIKQVFVGSEGTLGVITRAALRAVPMPEARVFLGVSFPDVHSGLEAVRLILRQGIRPAAVRLYDELDTMIALRGGRHGGRDAKGMSKGFKAALIRRAERLALSSPGLMKRLIKLLPANCLLVLTFEGKKEIADLEAKLSGEICAGEGGKDLGPFPGEVWWKNRYRISYQMSPLFYAGALADTIEVVATWDRVKGLYHRMREAISRHALVMAHFSHAYQEGASIYFTFASSARTPREKEKKYMTVWSQAMEACVREGGSISHHHGIGLLKAPWMEKELGEGIRVLKAVKTALDPKGIMNPGKLGL